MKKKLISILSISMIFILAGCSISDKKADTQKNDTDKSQNVKDDSENYSSGTKENDEIMQTHDNKSDVDDKKTNLQMMPMKNIHSNLTQLIINKQKRMQPMTHRSKKIV